MYISYCDTIRTKILNRSDIFGGGIGQKNNGLGVVWFFD